VRARVERFGEPALLLLLAGGPTHGYELLEGPHPRSENVSAVVGQRVRALRGAGQLRAPLRDDEPFVLERAKHSIDVADVDAFVSGELRQAFEELVAVRRAGGKQKEQRRLAEAFHSRADLPLAALTAGPVSRAKSSAAMHAAPLYATYICT